MSVADLRARGAEDFRRLGLPGRKIEAWHYTDLSQSKVTSLKLAEGGFKLAGALPVGVTLEPIEGQSRLGRILPSADLPLVGLNAHLFSDALVLRVSGRVETPIRLVSQGNGAAQFHGRLLVLVEKGASATLVELHRGEGAYFSNAVIEIDLAEGAELRHVTLQDESDDATHVSTLGIELAADARYRGQLLHLGGKLVRREVHGLLAGRGADLALDGAALVAGRRHVDNTTRIIHRAPNCPSRQLFKTVLQEEGHGVFQGTVLVERAAQKTNAYQLSRALLLSDRAAMDNKPELEIFADDVKCGHGATIGDIDAGQLFYMRARGIDEDRARQLLIEAFLAEALAEIADEGVRDDLTTLLHRRLTAKERT
jgi:Fe-S cluster assembly protein SufD